MNQRSAQRKIPYKMNNDFEVLLLPQERTGSRSAGELGTEVFMYKTLRREI
jgi:hypothetical protein